ncbi:bile acid:sodium symporter [Gordonia jinhuaensis]|uniref:Na+-dependent transporter n=1 Tax=Gordonia jinhuaensis TaxID=1517702 RepID=A0A916T4P3_9ACTN|nr:bile acid:sodium symporter family protein [Gordonia jinhuaensis]GGB29363.1 putative Na+-dependent transporter [Gordonia jinhuaensis]
MTLLRKLPIDGFVLAILATVAFASVLPATGDAARDVDWVVKIAIAALFFLYGAKLSAREALNGVKHWRLHATVLAMTFVVFPLIGLSLRFLSPHIISPALYTGLLFACLVPSTVQSSIAFTSTARGNVAGAIVSASLSNLVGVLFTPILVIVLMNTSGQAHVTWGSITSIVLQLLVPFLLGQALRPWVLGPITAHPAATKLVDRGSVLLVVYSAFSAGMAAHIWSSVSVGSILVIAATCAVVLAVVLCVSWFGARRLGFSREDAIVIQFCGSKKSLASGLPMAAVLFAGSPIGLIVLPLMMFHQIQLIVCSMIATHYRRVAQDRDDLATHAVKV